MATTSSSSPWSTRAGACSAWSWTPTSAPTRPPQAAAGLARSLAEELSRRLPGDESSRAELRARSWWSGLEIVVLVDDLELLGDGGSPLAPLLPYLPQSRDLGLHVVASRHSGGIGRALFEPFLQRPGSWAPLGWSCAGTGRRGSCGRACTRRRRPRGGGTSPAGAGARPSCRSPTCPPTPDRKDVSAMLRELSVEDVVPLSVDTGAQAAGSRRFTRVTVVGPTRRADVSVPDDLPVALVIDQVRPPADADAGDWWVLTHPVAGDLDPEAALGQRAVFDGELLYLRQHGDGYLPPYAEDAAEEAAGPEPRPGSWTEDATRFVLAAAAALWLGVTGLLLVWRFGPAAATPALVLVVALLVGAAAAGLAGHDLIGAALGWALPPAVASAAVARRPGRARPSR